MKRIVFLLLAAVLLLTACSAKQPEADERPVADLEVLQGEMLAADSGLPEMKSVSSRDEKGGELFAYLSDMDYETVEGYFLAYAADGAAYEIAVVAMKDTGDAAAMKDSLRSHVQGRMDFYRSYAPEELTRAEQAKIFTEGRYAVLIMCDDPASVEKAFRNGIQ